MKKRINILRGLVLVSMIGLQIGCSSTKTSIDQTEENEPNEIVVETISEVVEEASAEDVRPTLFMEGYRYDDRIEEYAISDIQGHEVLVSCTYYEADDEYRGVLKDLLPKMTER